MQFAAFSPEKRLGEMFKLILSDAGSLILHNDAKFRSDSFCQNGDGA